MNTSVALFLLSLSVAIPGLLWSAVAGLGSPASPGGLAGGVALGLALEAVGAYTVKGAGGGWRSFAAYWLLVVAAGIFVRVSRRVPADPIGKWGRSLLAVLLAVSLWNWLSGCILLPMSDSWIHLGRLRRVVEQHCIIPSLQNGTQELNQGAWYFMIGMPAWVAGADGISLWNAIPTLVGPMLALAAHTLALQLTRHRHEAVMLTLGFVCLLEGQHLRLLRELSYPRYVAWIPLLIALATSLRMARGGLKTRRFAAVMILVMGTALLHILEAAFFIMIIAATMAGLLLLPVRIRFRPLIRLGATAFFSALALGACVFLCYNSAATGAMTRVPTHFHSHNLPGVVYLFSDRWYIADPFGEFGATLGFAGVVATMLSPLILCLVKSSVTRSFLLGSAWAPLLIALNPLVLPVFLRGFAFPEVLHRLALLSSAPMLVPMLIFRLLRRSNRISLPGRVVLITALCLSTVPSLHQLAGSPRIAREEATALDSLKDLFRTIRLTVDGDSPARVLTDPFTGFFVYALTQNEPADFGATRTLGLESRFNESPALDALRKSWQSSKELTTWLRAKNVKFAIYHHSPPQHSEAVDGQLTPYYGARTGRLFSENPQLFRPLDHGRNADLYRIRTEGLAQTVIGKDQPATEQMLSIAVRSSDPAGLTLNVTEGLQLTGLNWPGHISPQPGTNTVLVLTWRARMDLRLSYQLEVTLQNEDYKGPLYHRSWGKAYRWIVEAVRGKKYQLRAAAGLASLDLIGLPLRSGATFREEIPIRIPLETSPGLYQTYISVLPLDEVQRVELSLADDPRRFGTAISPLRVAVSAPRH